MWSAQNKIQNNKICQNPKHIIRLKCHVFSVRFRNSNVDKFKILGNLYINKCEYSAGQVTPGIVHSSDVVP